MSVRIALLAVAIVSASCTIPTTTSPSPSCDRQITLKMTLYNERADIHALYEVSWVDDRRTYIGLRNVGRGHIWIFRDRDPSDPAKDESLPPTNCQRFDRGFVKRNLYLQHFYGETFEALHLDEHGTILSTHPVIVR